MALVEIGGLLLLATGQGRYFGSCRVTELENGWASGDFDPSPAYQEHSSLFRSWTTCVNEATFSCLDEIEHEIGELRIAVTLQTGLPVPVLEVQIYDDSDCIRVAVRVAHDASGAC